MNAGFDGVTITANDITVAGLTVDNGGTGRDGIVVKADGATASATNIDQGCHNTKCRMAFTSTERTTVHYQLWCKTASWHRTANTESQSMMTRTIHSSWSRWRITLGAGNNVSGGNTLEDLAVESADGRAHLKKQLVGDKQGQIPTPLPSASPCKIYYGAQLMTALSEYWTFDGMDNQIPPPMIDQVKAIMESYLGLTVTG